MDIRIQGLSQVREEESLARERCGDLCEPPKWQMTDHSKHQERSGSLFLLASFSLHIMDRINQLTLSNVGVVPLCE